MMKRPGRNESEEDLLRFQQEFFSSNEKPSVVIKKPTKQRDVVQLTGKLMLLLHFRNLICNLPIIPWKKFGYIYKLILFCLQRT